jgi:S1-C subfamily serine protease
VDAEWGLALFELEQPEPGAFSLANAGSARPGSFCAAVTLSADGRVRIIPAYVAAVEASDRGESLALTLTPDFTPAAIVNLDGDLLGIAVKSKDETKIVSSQVLLGLVARLQGNRTCHAIEVAEMSSSVRRLLGVDSGVVVERVREDAFVPEPSLRPGDVMLEWDGQPVPDVWTFHQLYEAQQPGTLVRFIVVRGRRRVSGGTIMPDRACRPIGESPRTFPIVGLIVRWVGEEVAGSVDGGWQVLSVMEQTPADTAGLREGDVLIRANRREVGLQIVPRALEPFERRPRPMLVTVRRADRVKLLALLPPGEEPS